MAIQIDETKKYIYRQKAAWQRVMHTHRQKQACRHICRKNRQAVMQTTMQILYTSTGINQAADADVLIAANNG